MRPREPISAMTAVAICANPKLACEERFMPTSSKIAALALPVMKKMGLQPW
jgi:hypothetical protein